MNDELIKQIKLEATSILNIARGLSTKNGVSIEDALKAVEIAVCVHIGECLKSKQND